MSLAYNSKIGKNDPVLQMNKLNDLVTESLEKEGSWEEHL